MVVNGNLFGVMQPTTRNIAFTMFGTVEGISNKVSISYAHAIAMFSRIPSNMSRLNYFIKKQKHKTKRSNAAPPTFLTVTLTLTLQYTMDVKKILLSLRRFFSMEIFLKHGLLLNKPIVETMAKATGLSRHKVRHDYVVWGKITSTLSFSRCCRCCYHDHSSSSSSSSSYYYYYYYYY